MPWHLHPKYSSLRLVYCTWCLTANFTVAPVSLGVGILPAVHVYAPARYDRVPFQAWKKVNAGRLRTLSPQEGLRLAK